MEQFQRGRTETTCSGLRLVTLKIQTDPKTSTVCMQALRQQAHLETLQCAIKEHERAPAADLHYAALRTREVQGVGMTRRLAQEARRVDNAVIKIDRHAYVRHISTSHCLQVPWPVVNMSSDGSTLCC